MRRTGQAKACPGQVALLAVAALLLAASPPLAARAAEWRSFGLDAISGYLALKAENEEERFGERHAGGPGLERLVQLRIGSYVLHPNLLSFTADTAVAWRSGSAATKLGLRNLDSGLQADILRQNPVSARVSLRSKAEDLERDFMDYRKETTTASGEVVVRRPRFNATLKCETTGATCAERFPEDRWSRVLTLEGGARPAPADTVEFRLRSVEVDDRLSAEDSFHRILDLSGRRSLRQDQGSLRLGLAGAQVLIPTEESWFTLQESWTMNWSPALRATEEFEITRRMKEGRDLASYRAGLDLTGAPGERWRLGGNLSALRYEFSTGEKSAVYRLGGTVGHQASWNSYQFSLHNHLSASRTLSDPNRSIPTFGEPHRLRLDTYAYERLLYPNVREGSIVVRDPDAPGVVWTDSCDLLTVDGYTHLRWRPGAAPPEGHEGQDYLDVVVDYVYTPPSADYGELRDDLSLRLSRGLGEGAGLASSLQISAVRPGWTGENALPRTPAGDRYEGRIEGFVHRPGYDLAGGATADQTKQTLFLRGSLGHDRWQLSELYQAEFFPGLIGRRYITRLYRAWGTGAARVNVELLDQAYLAGDRLEEGVTSASLRTTLQLGPFTRFELEGRGERERTEAHDSRLALKAEYTWRQGQLDFVLGYDVKQRTRDRYASQRSYVTVMRRF